MENPGAVLSKSQREERLYGWQEEVESNTVEVNIHKLRRRLFIALLAAIGMV